jgi:putative transposase
MALRYFTKLSTCSTLADAFDSASHDRLTRMLHGDWSGQILFDLALRLLFVVTGGYLMLDDTVVEKPYARLLGEAAWVWSNKQQKVVFGVSVVLLVWTDGESRIPVGSRVWHTDGPSKVARALALLSHARNRLQCQPQFVLFDAWYPAKRLRKRLKDSGGYFVCQLKKHRPLDGVALYAYHQHPSWHAVGVLSGGLKVLVVRHRRTYDVTHRLTLPAKEVRTLYRKRQEVEDVIRGLKSQLSLEACQGGDRRRGTDSARPQPRAQEHPMVLCLVASLMVERERLDQGVSWRKLKQRLILKGRQAPLPALERVRKAA